MFPITSGPLIPPSSASVVQSSDPQPSSGSASSSTDDSLYWPSFLETLQGYFTSAGAEFAQNREYNLNAAKMQNEWASAENEKARQWQEYMSSTNYQRIVDDLRKSGLNPILAVNGLSANTPSTAVTGGASASHQSTGSDTLSSLINAFANVAKGVGELLPGIFDLLKTKNKMGF